MQAKFLEYRPLQAFLALSASLKEEIKQGEEEYQKRAETNQHPDPSEKSSGVVQPMRKLWLGFARLAQGLWLGSYKFDNSSTAYWPLLMINNMQLWNK